MAVVSVLLGLWPFSNSNALNFIPSRTFFFLVLLVSFFFSSLFSFFSYSPFFPDHLFHLLILSFFSFSFFFLHGKLLIGGTIPSTMSNIASSRERLSRALLLPVGIKHWWICSSLLWNASLLECLNSITHMLSSSMTVTGLSPLLFKWWGQEVGGVGCGLSIVLFISKNWNLPFLSVWQSTWTWKLW